MKKVFNAYSSYYNLLYKDKDYVSEADYIVDLIKQHKPEAKTLVEFGSGTGKHALLFCEKGFQVNGVEPSAEMLKIAQSNSHTNLSFTHASIESLALAEKFDVATALFHVVSYLNENEELINSFRNIHKHLNEGGLFIFDLWYTPAVLSQVPEKRTKVTEDDHIKVIRNATPVNHWNKNIIDVIYDINVFDKENQKDYVLSETHNMRHFSIPEIELLAKLTGFEIIKTEEFLSGETPGPNTWGVCFVLRKV